MTDLGAHLEVEYRPQTSGRNHTGCIQQGWMAAHDFGLTGVHFLMKKRLTYLLLLLSLSLTGCARFTNMMALDGVSEVPMMTEPDLDDE